MTEDAFEYLDQSPPRRSKPFKRLDRILLLTWIIEQLNVGTEEQSYLFAILGFAEARFFVRRN